MARFFSPSRRPVTVPGSSRRFVRRPDLSGLFVPQMSGAPLSDSEIDYDDLIVHRTHRSFDPEQPGEVRYFMYELSQKNPGATEYGYFWKAIRLCRLTRIPRYLRQSGGTSGPHAVFEQQRDVLAALREKQVLFINLIAKSPQLPMIFAYGVQGIGDTPEEAQSAADEAYAVLTTQLDGTYQQLEYAPITLADGEALARYQAEWQHIAMGRGRPLASGGHAGSSSILDGNRSDVESTNNQLESFVRGMSDKSFMLSLVTVPLSPAEITLAWRNITEKLSDVRSDQDGSRSVSAGVALPLTLGNSLGDTHGNTHGNTTAQGYTGSEGVSAGTSQSVNHSITDGVSAGLSATASQGVSASLSDGVSATASQGISASLSDGVSASSSQGTSASLSDGVSASNSLGSSASLSDGVSASASDSVSTSMSHGQSLSMGDNYSVGASTTQGAAVTQGESISSSVGETNTQGASAAYSQGNSQGISVGQSQGLSNTQSLNQTNSVSESASLGQSASVGQNWANSIGQSINNSLSQTQGFNESQANGLSQSITLGNTQGDSLAEAWNQAFGNNVSGGLLGFGGGANSTEGQSGTNTLSNSNSLATGLTGSGTNTVGISNSLAQALSQGVSLGESFGGSLGQSATATNSVGASQSVGVGQSLSSSIAQSTSESASVSESLSQGLSTSQALSQSLSQGQSLGVTQNVGQGQSMSQGQSLTQGQSLSQGTGIGRVEGAGISQTLGQGVNQGISQGVNQTLAQGVNQGVSQGVSQTLTQGTNQGTAQGVSQTLTQGNSQSVSQGTSQGVSQAVANGTSAAQSAGANQGVASSQSLSDAYSVAMSRQASTSTSLGVVPQFGVALSKQTRDEAKRFVGDILEAQMRRYAEGIKSGAFLYQMFLVCPDRETLQGGSGLLKSSFWGAGGPDTQLPQPFHTIDDFEEGEEKRLLAHAAAFTSYRRREAVADLIEPFAYSTYLTPTEAAAFTHPPTSESLGLQAMADSMPVMRMPHDRQNRQIKLGHILNGERAIVSPWGYGIDVAEITHTLITGVTGSGKTTTLMRLLADATSVEKTIVSRPTAANPQIVAKTVRPSVLFLDWMRNGRNLASIVDPERFQFFSLVKPELGEFRWNLLAVPCEGMSPVEWLNAQSDNFVASFNLGEFGRSLLAEFFNELYSANRLEDYILRKETVDPETAVILRPAVILPAIPRDQFPDGAIQIAGNGTEYANVFTCWELSRCVSVAHLATLVAAKVETLADPNAARLYGTAMRDRLQSLWRRMQYFAPGGQFNEMLGCEADLSTYDCLTVDDIVDPDQGMVTVLETDGLDFANRRVILGSILLAVYRTGLSRGEGAFDHNGEGPGTFVVLEEAHELFGEQGQDEDSFSASTRTALYESMFRRARALGLRLVAVVQNPAGIPSAITSNTSTVMIHQTYDRADKERIFSLLNWSNQIGQQLREFRWLGEMPVGYCIVRLQPKKHYLEAAPVQILTDPAALENVPDSYLKMLANRS